MYICVKKSGNTNRCLSPNDTTGSVEDRKVILPLKNSASSAFLRLSVGSAYGDRHPNRLVYHCA